MAIPTREQIMGALYTLIKDNVTGIKTYSRRMTLPQQIGPTLLPQLTLWERPEHTDSPGLGSPSVRRWYVWLVVTFRNPSKIIAGSTILNPILDAIEDAIGPDESAMNINGAQTLGDLVQSVKIQGETYIELGDTDPDGLGGAVIPLEIVVP